jgi:putative ABC transport system substrate-binding protein
MKPQSFFWLLIVFLLIAAQTGEAQQAKKVYRIGYLSANNPDIESARAESIRTALLGLGFVQGQNTVFDYRHSAGKVDRLRELAAELASLKVDVIVAAGGTNTVRAAMSATKTIPIVMVGAGVDPVEAGLIQSLARPGGNVTGITNLDTSLGGKRLELLRDAIGKVTRVAVLWDPQQPGTVREIKKELPIAARELKLTLQLWEVRDSSALEKVFAALKKQRADGLYVPGGALLINNRQRIVDFALESRVPSMFNRKIDAEAGGLLYYGADVADSYRQVAWYVDKILKGTKPADLPVQQPMRFEFVVNLQTAQKIGVTINTDVLARATKIIR